MKGSNSLVYAKASTSFSFASCINERLDNGTGKRRRSLALGEVNPLEPRAFYLNIISGTNWYKLLQMQEVVIICFRSNPSSNERPYIQELSPPPKGKPRI
jgi:hypothetical protein